MYIYIYIYICIYKYPTFCPCGQPQRKPNISKTFEILSKTHPKDFPNDFRATYQSVAM